MLSSHRKPERAGVLCGSSISHASLALPVPGLAVEVEEQDKTVCVVMLPQYTAYSQG